MDKIARSSPLWRPYTQHALGDETPLITHAEGAFLYARDGRRFIDAISSWWVNTHGHCHPRIVAAVQKQAAQLDQIVCASFSHEPAERLAEELLQLAGAPLAHVFFADSGATAVEAALKMAIGYWAHNGQKRHKIVALEHGYHGDTFGAMAASGRSTFNRFYEDYLFDVARLPFPAAGQEQQTIDAFEKILREESVAALIIEPLIMGAGGMLIYDAATLRALAELCRRYGALLIVDEIMTGWGRTGTLFACEQAGIKPDIMCVAKGLTGGFLPLSAVLATADIFQAFYHPDRGRAFYHSSSFTGNALACAAALASIEIWREEPVLERIKAISARQRQAAADFGARDDVVNARSLGTILALDVRGAAPGYESPVAPALYRFFMENGVFLRPLGNTVYVMPPYCIEAHDLEVIYDAIHRALDSLRHGGVKPGL